MYERPLHNLNNNFAKKLLALNDFNNYMPKCIPHTANKSLATLYKRPPNFTAKTFVKKGLLFLGKTVNGRQSKYGMVIVMVAYLQCSPTFLYHWAGLLSFSSAEEEALQ